jgi:hypothetical protein
MPHRNHASREQCELTLYSNEESPAGIMGMRGRIHNRLRQKRRTRRVLAAIVAAIHNASEFLSTEKADPDNLNEACSSGGAI